MKESIFWVVQLFYIIYGILFAALLSATVIEFNKLLESDAYNLAQDVIKMWQQNFIIDITSTMGTCPSGWESMINYQWPGTVTGCVCPFEQDGSVLQ